MKRNFAVPALLFVTAENEDNAAEVAGRLCGWHDKAGERIGVLVDEELEPAAYDPEQMEPGSIANFYPVGAERGEPHVVAVGNPFDGLRLFGPFQSHDAAEKWAGEDIQDDWWIVDLSDPNED